MAQDPCKDFIALIVSQQFSILQDPCTLKQYESNLISLRNIQAFFLCSMGTNI